MLMMQGMSNVEKLQILVFGSKAAAMRQLADKLQAHSAHISLVAAYDPTKFPSRDFEDAMGEYRFIQTRPLDPKFDFSHQVGTHSPQTLKLKYDAYLLELTCSACNHRDLAPY